MTKEGRDELNLTNLKGLWEVLKGYDHLFASKKNPIYPLCNSDAKKVKKTYLKQWLLLGILK